MLSQLFQQVSAATFVDRYLFQMPLAVPGGAAHLTSLGDEALLSRLAEHSQCSVLRSRAGEWWPQDSRPALGELQASLADGWTLFVRHAEQYDAGLSRLADEFNIGFQAPIDIHFFCTPASTRGFGWHYDAEDVFLIQTAGSKKYWLRKNTVHPWPLLETMPVDLHYEAERTPTMEVTLRAGDWLYIPFGYWHTTAAQEMSMSLSVGVRSFAAIDLLELMRPLLVESLRWRQRLPLTGGIGEMLESERAATLKPIFKDLGADLAKLLASDEFLQRYMSTRDDKLSPRIHGDTEK